MTRNILSVYFFLLFVKVFAAPSPVEAQTTGGPNPGTPNPNPSAPANRSTHYNTVGWFNYFGTIKLSSKWGLHTEYQFRRNDLINSWQQGLLRVGVNYQASPNLLLRAGYAWIETYAYGEIPINGLGRDFTEHRLFQMAQLSHQEGLISISHRFILEQRFVGRYSSAAVAKEDEFPYCSQYI